MLRRLAELQALTGRAADALATWRAGARASDRSRARLGRARRAAAAIWKPSSATAERSPLTPIGAVPGPWRSARRRSGGAEAASRRCAEAAATAGLTDTAAALLDAAGPAPAAADARAALAGALAARGELASAAAAAGRCRWQRGAINCRPACASCRPARPSPAGAPDLAAAAMAGKDPPAAAGALMREIAWRSGRLAGAGAGGRQRARCGWQQCRARPGPDERRHLARAGPIAPGRRRRRGGGWPATPVDSPSRRTRPCCGWPRSAEPAGRRAAAPRAPWPGSPPPSAPISARCRPWRRQRAPVRTASARSSPSRMM